MTASRYVKQLPKAFPQSTNVRTSTVIDDLKAHEGRWTCVRRGPRGQHFSYLRKSLEAAGITVRGRTVDDVTEIWASFKPQDAG